MGGKKKKKRSPGNKKDVLYWNFSWKKKKNMLFSLPVFLKYSFMYIDIGVYKSHTQK